MEYNYAQLGRIALISLVIAPLLLADPSPDELKTKAEKGDPKAQEQLGLIRLKGGSPKEAQKWFVMAADHFKQGADSGDPEALFDRGKLLQKVAACSYNFDEGKMASENQEAAFCFIKGAYKGHALCQLFLANCYFFGQGVPQSDVEGMAWQLISTDSQKNPYMHESALDDQRRAELHIGAEKTALAKVRSAEIAKEIKASH